MVYWKMTYILSSLSYDVGAMQSRGLGTLVVSAATGLITLAVESLGSYLRNKQEKRINDAVLAMREDNAAVQNMLQQYSNDFLM